MAKIGYAGALGGMAKDAAVGAGKAFVGGLKGAVLREMPAVSAGMAFGKELSKRANAPKMKSGDTPPPVNEQTSTSPAMGGFGASVSLVAGQNKSNVINLEQVRQLKQLNDSVITQSKLIAFQIADQKRKDQFAEETANEQAVRDDELLKAIKNLGGGGGTKNKNTEGGEGGGGGLLGNLIGNYGKELALGGLAVLFRNQIVSMLAGVLASPLTGMAVNAAIAGGTFLATIGSGLAAALRMVLTTAIRSLLMNPIGLAALGLGALFYTSKKTEEKQTKEAIVNNQAVAPMPTKTFKQEAEELRKQAAAETNPLKRGELLEKAKQAQNNVAQEELKDDKSPLALANRQKAWNEKFGKSHNPDGTPKVVTSDNYLDNLARAESRNDPNAKSKTSSAGGLYQFLGDPKDKDGNPIKNADGTTKEGTWNTTVRKMLASGALDPNDAKNYLGDEFRFDPVKAKIVAAYFTEQNRIGLVKALGRDPTQADLYMAHFLGMGTPDGKSGAVNFLNILKDNPNGIAALVNAEPGAKESSAAASNPEIFYSDGKGRTKPRTLSEVYALMGQKIGGNNSSIGPQTSENDKKPSTANVPVVTPAKPMPTPEKSKVVIENKEAENYLKGLGVGAGGSTSNVGIVDKNLIANKIADRMDAEAGANTIGTDGVKSRGVSISDALRGLSAEEIVAMIPDFSRRYPGVQLAAGPGFNLGGGGGGDWDGEDKIVTGVTSRRVTPDGQGGYTGGFKPNLSLVAGTPPANGPKGYNEEYLRSVIDGTHPRPMVSVEKAQELLNKLKGSGSAIDTGPTKVIDEANLKVNKEQQKALALTKTQEKSGTALSTKKTNDEIERQAKVLKPLFKNNSDIIEETNKTFLQQFRSTATSAFQQAITKGLFPKGFGVSADTAGREDNYRGQQLQKIFGTDKVINEATTKLLGKQYGPMFAPLFNNLAQGYLEVGSRVAGSAIFQGIGGLGAKETHTITGQVLGNFAAGNKKLALEQLLYGASGGKESGIALGPETLFAKYGFKNPAEGIQYFSSVLGEQVTQPFSKLMGADDRSKSVVWNPRAGDAGTGAYVYVDSGKLASKPDIDKMGNYGAPVNPTSVSNVLGQYNNYRDPYGPGGPRNIVNGTYTSAGAASAYRQVVDPDTGKMVAPNRQQILGLTNQEYMKDKAGNDQKADIQIELMKQDAERQAKFQAEAIKAAAEREAKQLEANKQDEEAAKVRSQAEVKANEYVTKNGADSIVVAVEKAGGGGGSGSTPKGLELPEKGDIVRKSGQLFGGTADGKGNVSPLSGMQEIGNFAFDMAKNAAGAALTKDIKNPYMQMIANFAIQKGLNMGVDALLGKGGLDFGKLIDKGIGGITDLFKTPSIPGVGDVFENFNDFIPDIAGDYIPDVGIDGFDFFDFLADGGPVTGPGTERSDSIPAMLSNGEFVVNAAASKKYRPLLDALNYTKYADGTTSAPGSVNALSKALGTDKQLNALGSQTDLLTSIDNSLLYLSGGGSGSGTSYSGYGGTAFDVGLGSPSGGSISSGGGNTVRGVSRSRPTQQGPSTMDYVTAIGGQLVQKYVMSQVIGAASTAIFGATPGVLLGNALVANGFPTVGGMLGGTAFTGTTSTGLATVAGETGASTIASTGLAEPVLAEVGGSALAETGGAALAAEGGALGSIGSSLVAAAPYLLAAVAVFMIFDSYGGGGGGGPPPKEPKFHAAIYVAGNNNILAIATILETQDYHAVPAVFKTVAYGLLKVAFNATKTCEKVTNTNAPYDWVYIKVQFDRVSMLWGKGAPNAASIIDDNATEVKRWPALEESTNLNAYAVDIIGLIKDEFKKTASAENLDKLDKTAAALGDYSLNSLSSGLIQDLSSGRYKLDTSIEKGVFADNVAESNRISALVRAAADKKAYMSDPTVESFDDNTGVVTPASAGKSMVYSLKDNAFVENKYPGALILDSAGRPVYDIEGTSAGLSVEDFVSSSVAGANRPANVLLPPPTPTGSGGAGSTNVVSAPKTTIDNSQVTTFVNSLTTVTDVVRSTNIQVGLVG